MISVQEAPIDVGASLNEFARGDARVGGIATFVGRVRTDPGSGLVALTLEHYPGMTEAEIARIEEEARHRWSLLDTLIVHRYGRMLPGEEIVLVATASSHRASALEACAFLIDWLKTRAPFWKFEETADGGSWVEAREADDEAASRWGGMPRGDADSG